MRALVGALERAVIALAADYGIVAEARAGAPGVYVGARKLASVGVRIRRAGSYHGLALNVAWIWSRSRASIPAATRGLQMTQLAELGGPGTVAAAAAALEPHLLSALAG